MFVVDDVIRQVAEEMDIKLTLHRYYVPVERCVEFFVEKWGQAWPMLMLRYQEVNDGTILSVGACRMHHEYTFEQIVDFSTHLNERLDAFKLLSI